MHPFYFGIQKYKGQRPVCLPKPTYLPIVWSVDFYIEDYLLILKKYMFFLKEQGRMQDLNSFFIIYHSAYRTYYTAAQRFKRSLQFSYVQILIRFWCDKFFPFLIFFCCCLGLGFCVSIICLFGVFLIFLFAFVFFSSFLTCLRLSWYVFGTLRHSQILIELMGVLRIKKTCEDKLSSQISKNGLPPN